MTPDLILHHYLSSPFSEKIRRVLAFKKVPAQSVFVPSISPKPDVVALTGGYRRTPFLQRGADIYCDSALICDVLEHVQPEPPLFPPALRGCSRVFAQWADTTLFWTAMSYALQPRGAAQLFGGDAQLAQAFKDDRKAMRVNMTQLRPADATSALRSYLRRIASMVEEHDFLFGAEPCVADFSTYHPLWFMRAQVPVMADILAVTPAIGEWMERMQGLGQPRLERFSAEDAITVAGRSEPQPPGSNLLVDSAFQDDHGILLGSRVTITPESFGAEATEGELIAATRTHYSLRREDPRAGTVHVHFPRIGYVLRPAAAK
ncbi:glutathione S-transferase family protein [Ramlibacter rhizophilus]|uniref:Glutathione S-transferase family protein n=1 Tax=Ramlibacter rhizophilus TaxID=1781167 RepID=A0A4Z0C060_9BURK|nr:glutathione S-transferase family protein [Ramlibacter rhizophilus]TFZ04913.1 glutathione S-transferase family protein [Ramlibacter rhizophilus]